MGYRCAPGVTIFYYIFLDTFLHLFNVETGTINSAMHSNIYASIENLILHLFTVHEFSNWALYMPQLSC